MKALTLILTFCIIAAISQATPTVVTHPQVNESLELKQTQQKNGSRLSSSCVYLLTISTSCSSPSYTRDQISLVFGDTYGSQVYIPRLDDPESGTFEQCSMDEFDIRGPCINSICSLYLFRTGPDGWIPETVTVYDYESPPVTFYYNSYVPDPEGVGYGFDYCNYD